MKKIWIGVLLMICVMGTGCEKNKSVNKDNYTCTILVECSNGVHYDGLTQELKDFLPRDGMILEKKEVHFNQGDSVYDVLEKTMKEEGILMEASFTGNVAYIEGIDNLYEFECGDLSGWMYCVNGEYSNVGCNSYKVKKGDHIEWHYSCDLGKDLGREYEGK